MRYKTKTPIPRRSIIPIWTYSQLTKNTWMAISIISIWPSTLKSRCTSAHGSCDRWLSLLLATILISFACKGAHATDSKGKYVLIPTNWVQIQIPELRIKNVGRLLEGSGNATWGKNVVIKPGDFEIGETQHASYKGLKLLRDLSFNGITLKKGCVILLTGYPNYPKNDYHVGFIDCSNGIVSINGKHFSGVFHDFDTGVESILAPTLDLLEVKESFKLPNGRLIMKGTWLKASGAWYPDHSTNSLRIVLPPPESKPGIYPNNF